MPRALNTICRMSVVFCLCVSIGLSMEVQLFVLQSVAWARMIVSFSKSAPLEKALAMTFDGEHPCKLCKAIAKAKGSKNQKELQTGVSKIDLFCKVTAALLFPPNEPLRWGILSFEYPAFSEKPTAPPPKQA